MVVVAVEEVEEEEERGAGMARTGGGPASGRPPPVRSGAGGVTPLSRSEPDVARAPPWPQCSSWLARGTSRLPQSRVPRLANIRWQSLAISPVFCDYIFCCSN